MHFKTKETAIDLPKSNNTRRQYFLKATSLRFDSRYDRNIFMTKIWSRQTVSNPAEDYTFIG